MKSTTDIAGIVAIQAVRGHGLPHYVGNDAHTAVHAFECHGLLHFVRNDGIACNS